MSGTFSVAFYDTHGDTEELQKASHKGRTFLVMNNWRPSSPNPEVQKKAEY